MCVRDIAMHAAIDIPACLLSNTTTTSHISHLHFHLKPLPPSLPTNSCYYSSTGFIALVDGLEQCDMIH
jgi:hypothetical protein